MESVPLTQERLAAADAVVILTDHSNFDFEWIGSGTRRSWWNAQRHCERCEKIAHGRPPAAVDREGGRARVNSSIGPRTAYRSGNAPA